MDIDFPKQYSHLLDKYNITKEFNKTKSFLLELDNIPDFIYGINNSKEWFLAIGKNGLYNFEDSKNNTENFSLNEIHHRIQRFYDFIIGYNKEEKHLAPHPISGKVTEWDPKSALEMCEKLNKRIPELESIIIKDVGFSYKYAKDVIKGRWLEAEPYIMKDPSIAYRYAKYVIRGRWVESEPYILKNINKTYDYALDVIHGRWAEAESVIMKNPKYAYWYSEMILKRRWPEAEPYIMKDPQWAYWYALYVIKGRWPEAEKIIIDHEIAKDYANRFNLVIVDEIFVEKHSS